MKKKVDSSIHDSFSNLAKELDSLRKKVAKSHGLEHDLSQAFAEREAALNEVELLNQEVIKFNRLNDDLRKELSAQNKVIANMKNEHDELILTKRRYADVKMQLSGIKIGASELEQSRYSLQRLNEEVRKFDRMNDSLREELDAKTRALNKLRHDFSLSASEDGALKSQVRLLAQDVLKLNKLNNELRGFCSEKNKQMSHLNSDIDSYKKNIGLLKGQLSSLSSELRNKDSLVLKHLKEAGLLRKDSVEKERYLAQANNSLIELRQRLASYDKQIKDSDAEFEKFTSKFVVADKQNKALLQELDDANALITKLKRVVSEQNRDLADKEVSYSESIKDSRKAFEERLDEISGRQADKEIRFKTELNILKDALDEKDWIIKEKEQKLREFVKAFNQRFKELVYIEPGNEGRSPGDLSFMVESALGRGRSKEELVESLSSSGYSKKEIEKVIKKLV